MAGDSTYNPRTDKGPMLQLSGVSVAVQSFKARREELQALADCLPKSREARKRLGGTAPLYATNLLGRMWPWQVSYGD